MLYPIAKLIANQGNIVTIHHKATVRDAMIKMVQHDFSQLPVVDDVGNLTGLITEQTIMRSYYHANDSVSLFDLTVGHCQTRAVTLTADENLFDALDQLQRMYAIVITDDRKPVGILTFYDTTHFFRHLTEGQSLVEDIEITLRHYIEAVYATPERMDQALSNAFGQKDGHPARDFHSLSFSQQIQQITTMRNWSDFDPFFAPQPLFQQLMDSVRKIRNQLAHFRGDLDIMQFDTLKRVNDWLDALPKPMRPVPHQVAEATPLSHLAESAPPFSSVTLLLDPILEKSKYAPLAYWLRQQDQANPARITFEEIETLVGDSLPSSAHKHRSWWVNDPGGHSQSRAWIAAGWQVDDIDMIAGIVVFRYSINTLYQLFFAETSERLRAIRPDIGEIKTSYELRYCNFNAGRKGFNFGWVFLLRKGLLTELTIDTRDVEQNQKAFAQLAAHKTAIEASVGVPLEWFPILGKRVARISLTYPLDITAPPEDLIPAKTWAVDTMLKFMDAFQPLIRELF